jgi:hypothetical protein
VEHFGASDGLEQRAGEMAHRRFPTKQRRLAGIRLGEVDYLFHRFSG